MIDIIEKKYYFLGFSGALVLASVLVILIFGLHFGIDFTGGSILEVEFPNTVPPPARVIQVVGSLNVGSVTAQPTGERGMLIRFGAVDEKMHQVIVEELRKDGGGEIV